MQDQVRKLPAALRLALLSLRRNQKAQTPQGRGNAIRRFRPREYLGAGDQPARVQHEARRHAARLEDGFRTQPPQIDESAKRQRARLEFIFPGPIAAGERLDSSEVALIIRQIPGQKAGTGEALDVVARHPRPVRTRGDFREPGKRGAGIAQGHHGIAMLGPGDGEGERFPAPHVDGDAVALAACRLDIVGEAIAQAHALGRRRAHRKKGTGLSRSSSRGSLSHPMSTGAW